MKITWGKTLSVWWSYGWRCLLYGAGSGFVVGLIVGFLGGYLHAAHVIGAEQAKVDSFWISFVCGAVLGLVMSIIAMKQTLQKHLASLAETQARLDA